MVSIIMLMVAILIGGSLITIGILKSNNVDSKYSISSKKEIQKQLMKEKQKLIDSKKVLEEKIKPTEDEIKSLERETFTGFDDAYYAREDKIEELEKSIKADKSTISVIDDALAEDFDYCSFDEMNNNNYTEKYCSLKNQLYSFTGYNKLFDSFENIIFYMFGGFIILLGCMIAFSIYMMAKRREILAFSAQQVMPVAQESIEKMAPTVGNAAGTIAKSIKDCLKDDDM